MKLHRQVYKNNEDYWRMRQFLRQVMLRNARREFSWHVARLNYGWWFINTSIEKFVPEESIFIWETDGPSPEPQAGLLRVAYFGNGYFTLWTEGRSSVPLAEASTELIRISDDGRWSLFLAVIRMATLGSLPWTLTARTCACWWVRSICRHFSLPQPQNCLCV